MEQLRGFVVTLSVLSVVGAYTALGGPDAWLVVLLPALMIAAGGLDAFLGLLQDEQYRMRGAVIGGVIAGAGSFVLTISIISDNLLGIMSGSGLMLASMIVLEEAMEGLDAVTRSRVDVVSNHLLNTVFFIIGLVVVVPLSLAVVGFQPLLILLTVLTLFTATSLAFILNERSRKRTMDVVHETYEQYL